MLRFFIAMPFNIGDIFTVPATTKNHIHALRLSQGAEIELFNGNGNSYKAQITQISRKDVTVTILAQQIEMGNIGTQINTDKNSKIKITLAMSVISGDNMDLVVQKATELNVYNIVPILTMRTQQIAKDRLLKRHTHWHNIGISSSEQCGRNLLPIIEEPTYLNNYLHDINHSGTGNNSTNSNSSSSEIIKVILSPYTVDTNINCNTNAVIDTGIASNTVTNKHIILLVGPEGGFTDNEISTSIESGFTPLKLGGNILRAETAAIVGITTIQVLYNWSNTCKYSLT
jgi:16S rRNA (uracil1498-N3)-methyltransferase